MFSALVVSFTLNRTMFGAIILLLFIQISKTPYRAQVQQVYKEETIEEPLKMPFIKNHE